MSHEVGLLDVVPWTHGYVHSWAIRWILAKHDTGRDPLLSLFVPDGQSPWELKEEIEVEYRVGGHRADLRVAAADAAGPVRNILIETKVNDALSERQIRSYCDASPDVVVVVYAPGLTGLLLSGNACVAHERWVTGRQVVDALSDTDLPDLVRSYVHEVGRQADRMDAARAAARGERPDFPREMGISGVSGDDVEAVAWVAEVATAMRAAGAEEVWARDTAHDYGVTWAGSWCEVPRFNGAGVYVDVIAQHGGYEYAITIKVGGATPEDRVALFDQAMSLEPPWDGWRRGRRSGSENFRLWKLDASEMTAAEAANSAIRLQRYLTSLASPV